MAKKRQSSGLPQPRRAREDQEQEESGELRGYESRAEREERIQRQILLGVGATLALIALLLGGAFVVDQVINPSRNVASVDGEGISVADFETRVRIERALNSERASIVASQLINAGLTSDANEAINQAYQFDPQVREALDEFSAPDRLGLRVLNNMIDDLIVRQQADSLEIEVSDEEIDTEVEQFLGIDRELDTPLQSDDAEATPEPTEEPTVTPTPLVQPTETPVPTNTPVVEVTPTPGPTLFPTVTPLPTLNPEERLEEIDDEIAGFYRFVGREAEVSRDDIREYFRMQVLREKVAREIFGEPETSLWVNARRIVVQEEAQARDIIEALEAGESFAALARIASIDQQTGSNQNGGELGWVSINNFINQDLRALLTDQEIGIINTDPLETDFGWQVIQIRDREERDIEEREADRVLEEEFADWLSDQNANADIERSDFWPDVVPEQPGFIFRDR